MEINWKDETLYRSGERGVIEPATWGAKIGHLRICLTRRRHYRPYEWILNCEPFVWQKAIGPGTADEAKASAVGIVRAELEGLLLELRAAGLPDE